MHMYIEFDSFYHIIFIDFIKKNKNKNKNKNKKQQNNKKRTDSPIKFSETDIKILECLIDNIVVMFDGRIFHSRHSYGY